MSDVSTGSIKTLFTDHRNGGNCYILKADSKNRWCGFNKNTIDTLKNKFGEHFNLILWGTKSDHDFYCVPFAHLSHLFTDDRMTKGKLADAGNERWTATVVDHIFKMHANSNYAANIEMFYGATSPINDIDYKQKDAIFDIDFSIEDAKSVVNIRLGQSPFRQKVLENFNNTCCLSGISESALLVASHIVPWSFDKNYRGDPSNGLCLFAEFDAYFDKGYISLDDELRVIVSSVMTELDPILQRRLSDLEGRAIAKPTQWPISINHVREHRRLVFKG